MLQSQSVIKTIDNIDGILPYVCEALGVFNTSWV